jgi:hypothetical protein
VLAYHVRPWVWSLVPKTGGKVIKGLDMGKNAYNPSIQEAEAGFPVLKKKTKAGGSCL